MPKTTTFVVHVDAELDEALRSRLDEQIKALVAEELVGARVTPLQSDDIDGEAEFIKLPVIRPPLMGIRIMPDRKWLEKRLKGARNLG